MTICAVKWCSNSSGKQKKCDNITYHRFPSDPIAADRWIQKIRLNRNEDCWKPTKNCRICSVHFDDDDKYFTKLGLRKLRLTAVPTRNLHISCIENDMKRITMTSNELPQRPQNQLIDKDPEEVICKTSSNEEHAEDLLTQPSTSQESPLNDLDKDLEYIFDTPQMALLRNQLRKKDLLQVKHIKLIRALRQRNRRLKKKNVSLKQSLVQLKRKRYINSNISNILSENVFTAELCSSVANNV